MKVVIFSFMAFLGLNVSAYAAGECFVQKNYGDGMYFIQTGKVAISESAGVQSYKSEDGQYELKLAYLDTKRFDAEVLYQGKVVLGTAMFALNSTFTWT